MCEHDMTCMHGRFHLMNCYWNWWVFVLFVCDRSGWQWPSVLLASFGGVWDTHPAEVGLRAPPRGRLQQGCWQQQPAWCSADQWGWEWPHPATQAPQGWEKQKGTLVYKYTQSKGTDTDILDSLLILFHSLFCPSCMYNGALGHIFLFF